MNQTANATSVPSQPDVLSAWNTFKCSLDLGCQYQNTFNYQYPPNLVPPKFCPPLLPPPSFGGQSGSPGRRRKRQAPPPGGPGGPGGGTPPPVSPDFNTSAIFLQKYMELDEQDRFAIGHRFIAINSISLLFSNISKRWWVLNSAIRIVLKKYIIVFDVKDKICKCISTGGLRPT